MLKVQRLNRNSAVSKKLSLLGVAFLILLIIAAIGLHFRDHKAAVSGKIASRPVPSIKSAANAVPSQASTSSDNSTVQTPPTSSKYEPPTSTSDTSLTPPFGTFVSNHRPSLSGSDAQKSEQSTCNTNPGATCYIKFEQGSVVRTLGIQTTNSSGATVWEWNISDSGLTEGTWKVTAVASLNGKTQSALDPINLEVQP